MEKINGAELVARVLKDPGGSVEKLLQLSNSKETEWLELKSAILPEYTIENGKRKYLHKDNTNDSDYAWHVVKAIVAMANTHGGAVILGIDDNRNVVGLESSDKKSVLSKGEDDFARMVLDNALRPVSRCWNCCKEAYALTVSTYYPLLDYQFADYLSGRVVVIIVNPVPQGGDLIRVEESKTSREILLIRDIGEIGNVRQFFRSRDIKDFSLHREPSQESYALLYEQFRCSCPKPSLSDDTEPGDLVKAIDQYHTLLHRTCSEADTLFVHLDAEESGSFDIDADLFEPMAEEYLSFDMDWLNQPEDALDTDGLSRLANKEANNKTDIDCEEQDDAGAVVDFEDIRVARRGGVFSLLAEEPRAMLLGEPGGGKTTCLKHLALRAADQFATNKTLSLFVPLSRYQGPGDLIPLIVRATRSSKFEVGLTVAHIEWLLKRCRLQLLLDALNECPSEFTRHCVEDIQSLLGRYPDLPVIITARIYAYREQIGLPAFSIQPMDTNQQRQFLIVHLRNEQRAEDILMQIQQQPGGVTFSSNPLLLRLVVEAVRGTQALPTGRARMYRQFLERWYIREANKAESARSPLPWDMEQTLTILAHLAFQLRHAGLRSVSREKAIELLHAVASDPNTYLDRMAHGLILTCDFDGVVDFQHETFQEYLAAEYLVRNPESIFHIAPEDVDRWGMTLAYSIELQPQLPKALLLGLTKLSLWTACCADNAVAFFREIDKTDDLPDSLTEFFQIFLDNFDKVKKKDKIIKVEDAIKVLSSPLRYLLEALPSAAKRWNVATRFLLKSIDQYKLRPIRIILNENWPGIHEHKDYIFRTWSPQRLTPEYAILFIRSGLCQPEDFADQLIGWCNSATAEQAIIYIQTRLANPTHFSKPEQVIAIVKAGLSKPDIFSRPDQAIALVQEKLVTPAIYMTNRLIWCQNATPEQAIALVKTGFFQPDDFAGRVSTWRIYATIDQAIALHRAGLVDASNFHDRLLWWNENVTANQAIALVQTGIAEPNDFSNRIDEWYKTESLEQAIALVLTGFADPDDFSKLSSIWRKKAGFDQAISMVKAGFAHQDNFDNRSAKWIKKATLDQAIELVKAGFATPKDFKKQVSIWIKSATTEQAISLVQTGITGPSVFTDKISIWCNNATLEQAITMVQMGFVAPDVFTDRVSMWCEGANLDQAIRLVQTEFVKPDIFKDRVSGWCRQATADQAIMLIQTGLAEICNFPDTPSQQWINKSTPSQAVALIKSRLANIRNFVNRHKVWTKKATVDEAIILVQAGLLKPSVFHASVSKWLNKVVNSNQAIELVREKIVMPTKFSRIENALALIKANQAKADDFIDKLAGWRKNASLEQAVALLQVGMLKSNDFTWNISKWIKIATPDQAAELIKVGCATPSDFKDRLSIWCRDAPMEKAAHILKIGLATPAELNNNLEYAYYFLEMGLAKPIDFITQIELWCQTATIQEAIKMVESGLATPKDFKKLEYACYFLGVGKAKPEDFKTKQPPAESWWVQIKC